MFRISWSRMVMGGFLSLAATHGAAALNLEGCNPALVLHASSGAVVGVCHGVAARLENGTTIYTVPEKKPFLLAAAPASGKASVLWRSNPGGQTGFALQSRPDHRIQLLETLRDGTSVYMLFQREVVCTDAQCMLGKEQCSWDLLNTLYPNAVLAFNRDLDAIPSDAPSATESLQKDADHLFLAGLAGDGAARARLRAIPADLTERLTLRMSEKQTLIDRARALKCID